MTTKVTSRPGRWISVATAAALSLAAPQAWAQKAAAQASEDRAAFRESILGIKDQIDTTLGALDGIGKAKDTGARKSALKKYSSAVKDMSKAIDKTRDYAERMRERGQAYFKGWEKSMKGVTNEDLKAAANEHRAALQAQYEQIEKGMAQAKDDSAAFWKNVQDLDKFYQNDLSDNAISTSAKLVATTMDDGKKIQGYIDDVVKAVDEVGKQVKEEEAAAPEEATPPENPEGTQPPADAPQEKPPAGDPGLPPAALTSLTGARR
jgi:hypothetical protein